MSEHSYYEKLSALAALGEHSASETNALRLHLNECPECNLRAGDYARLQNVVLPSLDQATQAAIESSRNRVQQALWANIAANSRTPNETNTHPAPSWWNVLLRPRVLRSLRIAVASAGIAAIAFIFGMYYDQTLRGQASSHISPQAIPFSSATFSPSDIQRPQATGTTAQHSNVDRADLTAQLAQEHQREKAAEKRLATEDQALVEAGSRDRSLQAQIDQQVALVASMRSELDVKQRALDEATAAKSASQASLVALRYQVNDLSKKLTEQSGSLDRERELLSHGREIRDIIGARNLHIMDVYDTDPEGMTQKPFARAFYTEGKSLVFYAYDLPARRTEEGKYVYTAWGQSNGSKKNVRNLGILLNDDKAQKRWVFNFSDPNVLAEIDSVFITLERTDSDANKPSGRRMLTAYLAGQVNHP